MNNPNTGKKNDDFDHFANFFADLAIGIGKVFGLVLTEIFKGLMEQTIPLVRILTYFVPLLMIFYFRIDFAIWKVLGVSNYYLNWTYNLYSWFIVSSPFWIWGIKRSIWRRKKEETLSSIFTSAGMKNGSGVTPKFLSTRSNGNGIHTMKFKRNHFSKSDFEKAKPYLESGLHVYVDDFKSDLSAGAIDMTYSYTEMPTEVYFEESDYSNGRFTVGETRSKRVESTFATTHHLLIAGQTGSGKSTFLRSLITGLYMENHNYEFSLIDLKGGLEFQGFERLRRVKVIPNIGRAVKELKAMQVELERRMDLFRESGHKDIASYNKDKDTETLGFKVVVVDEAAEIFLGGYHATSSELKLARTALSDIARKGRAVGLHLVMATQRPDAKAIDPQVKTNLNGVICFQMPNNISSMTVIDSGQATKLPNIPGRALWKCGPVKMELQAVHLSIEEANELLKEFRQKTPPKASLEESSNEMLDMDGI